MQKKDDKNEDSIITTNREARRDYFVLDAVEAGLVLGGCEVKSLREKKASLAGSFARHDGRDIFLYNLYIAPYEMGGHENLEPTRQRKLLLHRAQIERLRVKMVEKGLALIPLKLYFKHGLAKVELALAKGKKLYDKRSDIKKQATHREIDRAIKSRNRK